MINKYNVSDMNAMLRPGNAVIDFYGVTMFGIQLFCSIRL